MSMVEMATSIAFQTSLRRIVTTKFGPFKQQLTLQTSERTILEEHRHACTSHVLGARYASSTKFSKWYYPRQAALPRTDTSTLPFSRYHILFHLISRPDISSPLLGRTPHILYRTLSIPAFLFQPPYPV